MWIQNTDTHHCWRVKENYGNRRGQCHVWSCPHVRVFLRVADGDHHRPAGRAGRVQIGAIMAAFRSPALKATSGMLVACVHARIAVRNRLPICSKHRREM